MGTIKILSDSIINKIAAGEVVERPASVVKELIENSLDAQATALMITVKHGGKELIRVADNGCGMSREDACLSLKRHATSKIESVEDIFRVGSFGFRGEALPSIAAVSRLTLLTREQSSAAGTEIVVAGGAVESVRDAGTAIGTAVEARDLFFNTPARQKFLRSERSEFLAIADVVTTFASGNPEVSFKLVHDTRATLDCSAAISLRERIASLHGEEIVAALIPVAGESQEIKISGFVTSPTVSRVNRTGQYLFINRRPIKSPALGFALQQGCEGLLPQNRHCMAFLFFEIVPSRVDVNVHPNKTEVRVANEREVHKLLVDTIRAALHSQWGYPAGKVAVLSNTVPLAASRLKHAGFQYSTVEDQADLPAIHQPLSSAYSGEKTTQQPESVSLRSVPGDRELSFLFPGRKGETATPALLGQYQASYIIAEYGAKLLIVDQHAAHERIMYEDVLSLFESGPKTSERLLIAATISLDYREQEALVEYLPLLEQIGFGVNDLGRNTYSIDAVPALLKREDSRQLILDIVHQALEGSGAHAVDDRKKALAAAIACKTKSLKASSRLQPEAMQHLVERLFQTRQPFFCPHGRPTCITFTREELEKRFGRK